jgi:hypothetical protein
MIATAKYNDNIYYKHAPQAYVPYAATGAPAGFAPSHPQAAADDTMLAITIAGMCLIVLFALPAGFVTGPWALKRAGRVEELVAKGHRPASDRGNVTITRTLAWISLALSGAIALAWLGAAALLLGLLAA